MFKTIIKFLIFIILFILVIVEGALYFDARHTIEKQQKEIDDIRSVVINQQALYTNALNSLHNNIKMKKAKE